MRVMRLAIIWQIFLVVVQKVHQILVHQVPVRRAQEGVNEAFAFTFSQLQTNHTRIYCTQYLCQIPPPLTLSHPLSTIK